MKANIHKIGFWSGIIAGAATIAYVIVQVLQIMGIFKFPYDEILIYGTSLCIVIPFILEILALHYITPEDKKFWSHAALIFTTLYAVFVTANYVVQLATVVPMKLQGRVGEIAVLEQYPHSMFWDYDALGYIFMGLTTFVALPIFEKQGFQKWVRWAFIANTLVTPMISIVYFYPTFSQKLLFLGFPWGITAPLAMLMLAFIFKKEADKTPLGDNFQEAKKNERHKVLLAND